MASGKEGVQMKSQNLEISFGVRYPIPDGSEIIVKRNSPGSDMGIGLIINQKEDHASAVVWLDEREAEELIDSLQMAIKR